MNQESIGSKNQVDVGVNQESIGSKNQVDVGVNHKNKIPQSILEPTKIAQVDSANFVNF